MHRRISMHILEHLTQEILQEFNLVPELVVAPKYRNRDSICVYDLIYAVIAFPESVEEASKHINSSKTCILAYLKNLQVHKPVELKWSNFLLKRIGYKYCNNCSIYKSTEAFNSLTGTRKRDVTQCKECVSLYNKTYRESNPEKIKSYYLENRLRILDVVKLYRRNNKDKFSEYYKKYYELNKDSGVFREYSASRRARKLHATPSWANLALIKEIYACAEGAHVDHIVPLQGKLVCGLHVESNLQYLTPEENLIKSNTFEA